LTKGTTQSLGWWALAALVGLAALAVCASGARAQERKPEPRIYYGFAGAARSLCWTPVLLEFPQGFAGGNFVGDAVIYPSGNCDAARGRVRTSVTLTAPEEGAAGADLERFWLYVRPGRSTMRASAYLEGTRRLPLFADLNLGKGGFADDSTAIVMAGRSVGLETVVTMEVLLPGGGRFKPFAEHYELVIGTTRQLPDRAIGYEGIDLLVLVDPQPGRDLRDDQVEAIAQFVESGGRLMVWVNRHWQEVARSRLGELLPADLGPLVTLADTEGVRRAGGALAPPLAGEVTVPAMRPRGGSQLLLAGGGAPVAVARTVGTGAVTLVGLDADSPALRSWGGEPALSAGLARLKGDEPLVEGQQTERRDCGPLMRAWLQPQSRIGSAGFFWAIILLGLIYIAVSGPVLYVVLRRHGRLNWSWPAYFSLSLAVAVVCFAIVWGVRNRDVLCTTLTVVDIPAEDAAVGRSRHVLRFPDSKLYDVSLDVDALGLSAAGVPGGMRSAGRGGYLALEPVDDLSAVGLLSTNDRLFDHAATLLGLEGLAVKSNQFRYFASRWRAEVPAPLTVAVADGAGGLEGTVGVNIGPIYDAVLLGPRHACLLATPLQAGQQYSIDRLSGRMEVRRYLQNLATEGLNEQMIGMGHFLGHAPSDLAQADPADVVKDLIRATGYEMHRRDPGFVGEKAMTRVDLARTDFARQLDLTHLLDAGRAVIIGRAEIDVPDGLRVDGRKPDGVRRLVMFRQVVRLKGE